MNPAGPIDVVAHGKSGVLDELYELFPILAKRSAQYARTLSGGERQRVCPLGLHLKEILAEEGIHGKGP